MIEREFCVFVSSIRPRSLTAPTLANLYASLTRPSDVVVAYGDGGKSRTQDDMIQKLAKYYKYWAAFDDDILVKPGWQDAIDQAFRDVPKLGAAGIEYVDNEECRNYMMEVATPQAIGSTVVRLPSQQNLTGACIVTPTLLTLQIGPVPVIDKVKYEFYEDGYRCHRLKQMGYRWGYVRCPGGGASMVSYPDSKEYLEMKENDIKITRKQGLPWAGLPPSP